jgi:hypothetical protein
MVCGERLGLPLDYGVWMPTNRSNRLIRLEICCVRSGNVGQSAVLLAETEEGAPQGLARLSRPPVAKCLQGCQQEVSVISFDQKKGSWRVDVDRKIDGKRYRQAKILPKSATEEDARAVAAQMERALIHAMKVPANDDWDAYVDGLLADGSQGWLDQALGKCRYRAGKRGHQCSITREFIADRLRLTRGRCELTGIRFVTDKADETHRQFSHSIDRIDSKVGYTRGNIRIVCAGVNVAMMHWGEAMFAKLAMRRQIGAEPRG